MEILALRGDVPPGEENFLFQTESVNKYLVFLIRLGKDMLEKMLVLVRGREI